MIPYVRPPFLSLLCGCQLLSSMPVDVDGGIQAQQLAGRVVVRGEVCRHGKFALQWRHRIGGRETSAVCDRTGGRRGKRAQRWRVRTCSYVRHVIRNLGLREGDVGATRDDGALDVLAQRDRVVEDGEDALLHFDRGGGRAEGNGCDRPERRVGAIRARCRSGSDSVAAFGRAHCVGSLAQFCAPDWSVRKPCTSCPLTTGYGSTSKSTILMGYSWPPQ